MQNAETLIENKQNAIASAVLSADIATSSEGEAHSSIIEEGA